MIEGVLYNRATKNIIVTTRVAWEEVLEMQEEIRNKGKRDFWGEQRSL